jgi:tRNA pseudouridine55 synthase
MPAPLADGPSGVLLLRKPRGISSRALLDEVEERLGLGPLGHAGTLDLQASGLIVGLAGRARRLQPLLTGCEKVYLAVVRLGARSRTGDAEGPLEEVPLPPGGITDARLAEALERFRGPQEQVPPRHSAIRVQGRRAYDRARDGEEFVLPARRVEIHELALCERHGKRLRLRVRCSAGTYVRALARDLGQALGTAAYLEGLLREASGPFRLEEARDPGEVELSDLLPLGRALEAWPGLEVGREEAHHLFHGRSLRVTEAPPPVFARLSGNPICLLRPSPDGVRCARWLAEGPP